MQVHIKKHVPLLLNSGIYFELDKTQPEHLVRRSGDEAAHIVNGRGKGWSLLLNETYRFYQVHWHAPSENRIDGREYALEAHYVHQLDIPSLVGSNERLGVIAVLYELSQQCNPQLDQFWDRVPMRPGDAPFDETVDMSSWLEPLLPGGYYSWSGSLTTPPCTEGVSWNLLRQRSFVCDRQLERLKASLAGMQEGVDVNNRVIQPLHGRSVRVSTSATATPPATAPGGPAGQPEPLTAVLGLMGVAATAFLIVVNCGAIKRQIMADDQKRREAKAGRTPASRGYQELA